MGQVYLMRWVFIAILKKSHTLEIRMFQFGHLNVFRISIFEFRISATSRENGR